MANPKIVSVAWDEIYGPVPFFEGEKHPFLGAKKIEVAPDTARRWKRVKKQYLAMRDEIEDLVPR